MYYLLIVFISIYYYYYYYNKIYTYYVPIYRLLKCNEDNIIRAYKK